MYQSAASTLLNSAGVLAQRRGDLDEAHQSMEQALHLVQDEGEEGQEGERQEGAEQQGDPSDEFAEAWSEEDAQAMEQWLRRIPNDPGGLLRRKFRYQYQRMGRDQDGNNLWPDDEVQPR